MAILGKTLHNDVDLIFLAIDADAHAKHWNKLDTKLMWTRTTRARTEWNENQIMPHVFKYGVVYV